MTMNQFEIDTMEHKVKAEVLDNYCLALKTVNTESITAFENQAYGVIKFACSNCFPKFNEELAKWWEDVMLPKFENLK